MLSQCCEEFIGFLNMLKIKNKEQYQLYFRLFIEGMVRAEQMGFPIQTYNVTRMVSHNLFPDVFSLNFLKAQTFILNDKNSHFLTTLKQAILTNISPKNEDEYIEISDFCLDIDLTDLQEQLLVEMIIFNYYKENKQIHDEFFSNSTDSFEERQRNDKIVRTALDWLKQVMPRGKVEVVHFIGVLK